MRLSILSWMKTKLESDCWRRNNTSILQMATALMAKVKKKRQCILMKVKEDGEKVGKLIHLKLRSWYRSHSFWRKVKQRLSWLACAGLKSPMWWLHLSQGIWKEDWPTNGIQSQSVPTEVDLIEHGFPLIIYGLVDSSWLRALCNNRYFDRLKASRVSWDI